MMFVGTPLLPASLALVFSPSSWAEAGFVEVTLALVALLATGMIASHVFRRLRRDG